MSRINTQRHCSAVFTTVAPLVLCLSFETVAAQSLPPSPIQGTRVKNGETIVVEDDAKVKIIRRREAEIRALYNPVERWVILLADYAVGPQKSGDGGVDMTYTFQDVSEWPLGERWSGRAVLDDYLVAGEGPYFGLGVHTSAGFVQLLSVPDRNSFKDPAALALYFRGLGRGGGGGQPMDIAEAREVEQAQRNTQRRTNLPPNMKDIQTSAEMGVMVGGQTAPGGIVVSPGSGGYPPPQAPVRVGGNIRAPEKIHHVDAVRPKAAEDAGVFGMVILEIVIGVDGTVTGAKVLRSIQLLDGAAIAAVKQWRYTVTHLNGQPVPVVMTVTVNFH